MKRLGYTRYVAQGGDWGAFVVDQMGLQAPAGLLATLLADEHRRLFVASLLEIQGRLFNAKGVTIPVAVSVFPGEQYHAPRSWTERAYPNLIHFNKLDRGEHFAAWKSRNSSVPNSAPHSVRCANGPKDSHMKTI